MACCIRTGQFPVLLVVLIQPLVAGGTGIRGQIRRMATLPQDNWELLVVRDKVGRPQVSLG